MFSVQENKFSFNKIKYKLLLVAVFLIAFSATFYYLSNYAKAATCTTLRTGTWNDPTDWDCGYVPSATDNAIIATGHTTTMDLDGAGINNLTINGSLVFATGYTYTLNVSGNMAISGGNLTGTGAGFINIDGNLSSDRSAMTTNYYLTIQMQGTNSEISGTNGGYLPPLAIMSGKSATIKSNISVRTLTISGTLDFSTASTVTTIFTGAESVLIDSGGDITGTSSGAISILGYLTANNASLTSTSVDIIMPGAAKRIYGDGFLNNLVINGTTSVYKITTEEANITVANKLNGTGTLTVAANTTLNIQIDNTVNNDNFSLSTLTATAGTVNYNRAGDQKIRNFTYGILGIGGTGTKSTSGNQTINTSLTIDSTFNIASSYTLSTSDVVINSGGVWNESTTADITFIGNLTNYGTFNASTGNHFFTNSKTINGDSEISIPNITLSGARTNNGILTVTSAFSASGAFNFTNAATGTLNINVSDSNFSSSVNLIATAVGNTVKYGYSGDQTVRATATTDYSNLIISGSGTKTVNGNLFLTGNLSTGNGDLTVDSTLSLGSAAYVLSIYGTTTVNGTLINSGTGLKTYTGAVTINSGASFTNPNDSNLTFSNSFTNNSTATTTLGTGNTIIFNGAIACELNSVTPLTISNFTVNGGATYLTNNISGDDSLTDSLTILTALSGLGHLVQGTNANLVIGGTNTISYFDASAGGNTVTYNGGDQTIKAGGSYYNLVLSGSGTKAISTYTTSVVNLTVDTGITLNNNIVSTGDYLEITDSLSGAGSLVMATNSYLVLGMDKSDITISTLDNSASGTTITYNRAGSQALKNISYQNLILSGSGTKTTDFALSLGGSLQVVSGATFTLGNTLAVTVATTLDGPLNTANYAVNFKGNLTNNNSSNDFGTSAVTFDSALDKLISGTNSVVFYDLIINVDKVNNGLTGSTSLSVSNSLTGTGVLRQVANANLVLSGSNFSIASLNTAYDNAGNTVTYNGNSQPIITPGSNNYRNLVINQASGSAVLSDYINISESLTLLNGNINTNGNYVYINNSTGSISRTNGHIIGNLRKRITTTGNWTFEIGDSNYYTPVELAVSLLPSVNDLTFTTIADNHPDLINSNLSATKNAKRYWQATAPGLSACEYDAVFNFNVADVQAGADPASFIAGKYNGSSWSNPTVGTKTSTSTQITGQTGFSDFQFGEEAGAGVSYVTSSNTNGTYYAGETISIQVVFDSPVTVTGTPQLTLETGLSDAVLDYVSGSGTDTLTFSYTITGRQESADLDYASTTALSENGGSISADLTLPTPGATGSLGANKDLVVYMFGPINVTSSTANGTYFVDDTISIQMQFPESVIVSGTPQLTLETGNTDAIVNYSSGSGTDTLTFTYTISGNQNTEDLEFQSINALSLNGGSIANSGATKNIVTELMSKFTTGSLGVNKNIAIEIERSAQPIVYLPLDEEHNYQTNEEGQSTPDLSGYYFDGVFYNYDEWGTTILNTGCVLGNCLNLSNHVEENWNYYLFLKQRGGDLYYTNQDNIYLWTIGRYKYNTLTPDALDPHDYPFSASAWIYINSSWDKANNWTILLNKITEDTSETPYIWFISTEYASALGNPEDGQLRFWLGDTKLGNTKNNRIGKKTVGYSIDDHSGIWQHLAVTYDGSGSSSGIKLYLDGQEMSSVDDSNGAYVASGQADNHGGTFIGGGADNFRADGKMDEFRMYDYMLSSEEVVELSGYFSTQMSIYNSAGEYEYNANTNADRLVIRYNPTRNVDKYDGFQFKFLETGGDSIKLTGSVPPFNKTQIYVSQNDRSTPSTCKIGGQVCYDNSDCDLDTYCQNRCLTELDSVLPGSGYHAEKYFLTAEETEEYQKTVQIQIESPCIDGQKDYDVVIVIQSNAGNNIVLPALGGLYNTEITHWDLGVTETILNYTYDFDDPPGSGTGVSQDTLIKKIVVTNKLDFGNYMAIQGILKNPDFLTYSINSDTCQFLHSNYGNLKTCSYTATVSTNLDYGYTSYVKVDGPFTNGTTTITPVSDGYVTPSTLEHGVATSDTDTVNITAKVSDCASYQNSTDPMPAIALTTTNQTWAKSAVGVIDDEETLCHALAISKTLAPGTYSQQIIITIVGNF